MAKTHVFVISMLLGIATGAGAVALVQSVQLGQAASAQASSKAAATSAWVAKRNRAFDQAEIALRRALRKAPPKLPKIPHFKPVSAPPAPALSRGYAAAPAAPAVRYVRPAPIVVVKHRHHGDDGGEDGGGGDD
jgi:hypothetical protein